MRIFKTIFFLSIIHISVASSVAQTVKDTIYFDNTWAICTQPLASYYRICTLNKVDQIFYKGIVSDYYINGQLEMTGKYDSRGLKTGPFVFYRPDGSKLKNGEFVTNTMKGIWNFYDKAENVKARFDCISEDEFTPLFIIKNNGDTILQKGTGKFSFNPLKDLPDIFPSSKSYNVTGSVINGKKEGIFTYSPDVSNNESRFEEYYKEGEFLNAIETNTAFHISENRDAPFTFLSLKSKELENTDNFVTNDLEFGHGSDQRVKLVLFLLKNQKPEIVSQAVVYNDNYADFFNIIGRVLAKSVVKSYMQNIAYTDLSSVTKSRLLSVNVPAGNIMPPVIEDTAEFLIDAAGVVDSATFRGNLNRQNINAINYFLSNLSGLVPFTKAGLPASSKFKMHIYTIVKQPEEPGEKTTTYHYFGEVVNENSTAKNSP